MMQHLAQPAILAPIPPNGRSLVFRARRDGDPRAALVDFARDFDPACGTVGLGEPLIRLLGTSVSGLRSFPALSGPGVSVPSTQQALWLNICGNDRSAVFDRAETALTLLAGGFVLEDSVDTFRYAEGRDLTGYLDGTANPAGDAAAVAALVGEGAGRAGSSFVAVQRWVHDLAGFRRHSEMERDAIIGRAHADNEELEEAPPSAHVKRAEQEDYDPPAFVVRRAMPWSGPRASGSEFIAYGASLDAYERILRRMTGAEDGIVDALFSFSRPVTGGYYWCPPLAAGKLDLASLQL
jgi:putative iron-dependent peroxidase